MTPLRIISVLALASLVLAWVWMGRVSQTDPWYRNTDMNIHNTADALAINSGLPPHAIDQPGVPMKFLLALDFRARHFLGQLPVWNLKKFGDSADPLREIPGLIRVGRVHSRILVLAFIISGSGLIYTVTRSREATGLTVILLSGCFALIFHGLFTRPELLCVGFGIILAPLCTWRSVEATRWSGKYGWLLLAGIFGGLSAMEKLPGVCYVALCYGWCWLGALTAQPASAEFGPSGQPETKFWYGLLPLLCGASLLGLLFHLEQFQNGFSSLALFRLRTVAVFVSVLPLLALGKGGAPWWRFLVARAGELAVLGGGTLISVVLIYFSCRGVMPDSAASDYVNRTLSYLFDPATTMKILFDTPRSGPVLVQYFQQNPILFTSTALLAVGVFLVRAIPIRLKAFIALLLAGALGMTLVMSQRHFTMHYSIFAQIPLLLAWPLCLYKLSDWMHAYFPEKRSFQWILPAAASLAFAVVLTAYPRLQFKYERYQIDATLPVNNFTLTFLFDHDVHPAAYLKIMRDHYGDREQFARTLDAYLADSDNRY